MIHLLVGLRFMAWFHAFPISDHPLEADFDCSGLGIPAKFAVTGDFDGDARDEVAIALNRDGSAGNDFWVMKLFPGEGWAHMSPVPAHPLDADIDCSGADVAAKFAVAGDFDGNGQRNQLAICIDRPGTAGNDFWVMRFDQAMATWFHMSPIPGHPLDADFDCSGVGIPAKFAIAGDFDNDGRDEIAIALDRDDSAGNDFWVMKFDPVASGQTTAGSGSWVHFGQLPSHPVEADIDCSGLGIPAKFAVTGDFDGDGRDEIASALNRDGSAGNDFWVMAAPQCVRLHVKILTHPDVTIATSIDSANQVYAFAGLKIVLASTEIFVPPPPPPPPAGTAVLNDFLALNVLDKLGPEHDLLFQNRSFVGSNDVVVYFVLATNPPSNGYARVFGDRPGAVVVKEATEWTLGHEIGHVLGLPHVDDPPPPDPAAPPALLDRLMTGRGTKLITNPPPDIIATECGTLRGSRFSGRSP